MLYLILYGKDKCQLSNIIDKRVVHSGIEQATFRTKSLRSPNRAIPADAINMI